MSKDGTPARALFSSIPSSVLAAVVSGGTGYLLMFPEKAVELVVRNAIADLVIEHGLDDVDAALKRIRARIEGT